MSVGANIKQFRTKAGLTQKDLADKLFVTYQAVSRWENEEAEPSFETLKEICNILKCSTDDLFGIKKEEVKVEPEPVKVVEKVIVEQPKVVLAICDRCHKPIYKPEDLKRHEERTQVLKGRITETQVKTVTLCGSCEIKRLEEEKIKEEKAIRRKKYELKKIRIHSFVWPGLLALALIIFGIVNLTSGNNQVGFSLIIISIFAFTFLATIILDNTFVSDVWITVRDWGFVTMPGIIFELSFDGLVFLIVVKILFFIIGMIISIAAFILATVLAAALSIIGYPLGLYRNIKGIEV